MFWLSTKSGDKAKTGLTREASEACFRQTKYNFRYVFKLTFPYFIIFLTVVFLSLPFQLLPRFTDGDTFYHLKMAEIIKNQGIITNFPWLPYTVLNDYYTDHHFLYHYLWQFIIDLGNPFVTVKILQVLMIFVVIGLLYFLLRKNEVKYPLWFSLLSLTSFPFLARINAQKVSLLGVILSLLCFYLICRRRYAALFCLSFFYVYFYGGWPVALVLALFAILSEVLAATGDWRTRLKILWSKSSAYLLISVIAGLAAGLVFNPYFPQNIRFYFIQIIDIAFLNLSYLNIAVREWQPITFFELFVFSFPILILLGLSLVLTVVNFKKRKFSTVFSLLVAGGFLIMTMMSRRYIEYYVPYSLLFSALTISSWQEMQVLFPTSENILTVSPAPQKKLKLKFIKTAAVFLIMALCLQVALVFFLTKSKIEKGLQAIFAPYNYQSACLWTKNNIAAGEVIYHFLWEEFPALFYYDDTHRYINGLDYRFLAKKNQPLAQKYLSLLNATEATDIYARVKNDFLADYILINTQYPNNEKINSLLAGSPLFLSVYQDNFITIYRLKE